VSALDQIRRLWAHLDWADDGFLDSLRGAAQWPDDALTELAHILGAEENWLARLEGRKPTLPIWPALSREEMVEAAGRVKSGYAEYLASLQERELPRNVAYTNSAGRSFETPIGDILLHVALHGQYHRGKVNVLLRQSGGEPIPADFISFARGAPAAITPRP
jgi:uncharacterized damage-inducible protein DinB